MRKYFYLLANIIFHYFCTSIFPHSHPYSNPNQTKNKTKEHSASIVLEDISGWKLQQTKSYNLWILTFKWKAKTQEKDIFERLQEYKTRNWFYNS